MSNGPLGYRRPSHGEHHAHVTRTGRFLSRWQRPFLLVAFAALAAGVLVWRIEPGGPPEAFEDRTRLPSCGVVEVSSRTSFETPENPATVCFAEALRAGAPAELVERAYSAEGTLTVTYFRSLPGEPRLEYFEDATADHLGSQEWAHVRCSAARGLLPDEREGCETVRVHPAVGLAMVAAGLLLPVAAGVLALRTVARSMPVRAIAVGSPIGIAAAVGWWAFREPSVVLDAYLFGLLSGVLLVGTVWTALARGEGASVGR